VPFPNLREESARPEARFRDILGVHLKTVDRWRANHKRQGIIALRPKKNGCQVESDRNLTPEQEKEIQKKIPEKPPD